MMEKDKEEKTWESIKEEIIKKLHSEFGRTLKTASPNQLYKAVAIALRDRIMEKWAYSKENLEKCDGKELYYLSMEFLLGKSLINNAMNLHLEKDLQKALKELGLDMEDIEEKEPNAGLGNGGLGRLAACFLDSLATLGYQGHGNGIRYEYGLFKQKIIDGYQVEMPDPWLEEGNVWEVAKPEEPEIVCFGGVVEESFENGKRIFTQKNCECVKAIPYDVPIIGYGSSIVNTLRLWGAKSIKPLDMELFGKGQHIDAIAQKENLELISKVLYPEDKYIEGKVLRLKQQYFFVSASIQSLIRKYKKKNKSLKELHKNCVIHINDTHPALAIPEMMRILMDIEGFGWEEAWEITSNTFAYTNHTIMEEALEKWPIEIFKELLPRIYMIIHEINEVFCRKLWEKYPGQWNRISDMAIIANGEIRMAYLAIVGSFSVNGVAALHTDILKEHVFKEFYLIYPNKFKSITNGVTHRRFLLKANPQLSNLITENIGQEWITDPIQLKKFQKFSNDTIVQEKLRQIRQEKKTILANYIYKNYQLLIDPDSIFDVQIKRLHEYKRQLLNVLHILYLYNILLDNPNFPIHPRSFIFGAKAAPGYHNAKLIIKLIHSVGKKINQDKGIQDKLKVVFIEDYSVSLAEKIIPAADVSEQISTASKEASGTGNMKFMMNGALTVGTLDGANVEIKDHVGADNIYIFGLTAEEVNSYYRSGLYNPREIYEEDPLLKKTLDQLVNGFLEVDYPDLFRDIYHGLLDGNNSIADPYFVLKDFEAYYTVQARIGKDYKNPEIWWKKAIMNIANSGYFSSDRTIEEYNEKIWNLSKHCLKKEGVRDGRDNLSS